MPLISVVTPVYKCCAVLDELYERLVKTLQQITDDFEIIMVNDSSPDDAWYVIQRLAQKDTRVKGIKLSRNFGQHYAITAGLDFAHGNWVVVMDCDLQDQPEEITKLYHKALEGYDMVVGLRAKRKDNFFKKLTSRLFYAVFDYFTGTNVDNRIGNFGIYSQKVIESMRQMREQNRSFGLFAIWVGFKRAEIEINHAQRKEGKSGYNLFKRINLAIDSITAYTNKLLLLSIKAGFVLATLSIVYSIWLIIRYYLWSITVSGWTSLIVTILFSTGLILTGMGILGLYIGKIFDEVKKRPLYIIESTTFD